MKSKLITFGILLMGILLIGCSKELTTEEIQNKLIQANSNLNSYSVDMKMSMNMVTEMLGQQMNIKSDINSKGNIDRTNKKMVLKGTVKYDTSGMRTEMDTETYALDNYLYTKTMNMWMKMKLDKDIWTQQDQVSQIVELVQSGTIERLEDETIDKNPYYVIKINPDLKKVVELALQQQQQSELLNQNMDFGDMIKSYSSTIWVNKKTFVIEKSKTDMKMLMTPENMGKKGTTTSGEIEMDSSVEIKISNINKDFVINLPEEAKDAMDLTELKESLNQKSEQAKGTTSITGNAIAEVFS